MNRRTSLALGALFLILLAPSAPAIGANDAQNMRGSYFGSFTTSTGNTLFSDINITLQAQKVIGGTFNMGAVLRGVVFSGKCRPNGGFVATAVIQEGDGKTKIRLNGTASPAGNGLQSTLIGTYRLTGRRKERGTFHFTGRGL